jgi:hypothetical protein
MGHLIGTPDIDPGEIPAYLPALTQVEETIIARSYV